MIDDCDAVRAMLVAMLAAIDYDVLSASSGAQGLEQIAQLGDCRCPDYLVYKRCFTFLRERFSELPAVLISGGEQSFFRDVLDCLSNCVFLQKQFSHAQLTIAIALAELNVKKSTASIGLRQCFHE